MTLDELKTLKHFTQNEADLEGRAVNWPDYYYPTMQLIDALRGWVDSPCTILRGDHNLNSFRPHSDEKATAIDVAFKHAPYSRVVMDVMRLPCSWGVYTGKSVHVDIRKTQKPARWMAFRPGQRDILDAAGLASLIVYRSDGWLYLNWSTALSLKALYVLTQTVDAAGS